MTASNSMTTAMVVLSTRQAQSQGTNAEAARALQEATTARAQARAAEQEARAAQNAAQAELRQAQQDMEQAKREMEQAIQEATQAAGTNARAGTPEVLFPPFPGGGPQIPDGAVVISVAFFIMCAVIAVGLPIARAFSRRVDRKHAAAPGADSETRARLERIEQAVDAIAVEVERISEGQRYTTKVIGEIRALPQPDPAVAVPDRVAVPISRAREAR